MKTVLGFIDTFAETSTPAQGGVSESEFWPSGTTLYSSGAVGNAVPSSNWTDAWASNTVSGLINPYDPKWRD